MSPIPDETDNPTRNDPNKADDEELEVPDHIFYPVGASSSDDEDEVIEGDSGGYMLLPQEVEEDEEGAGSEQERATADEISVEPMTDMPGPGIDMSNAVAQGSVHPAFIANFPDNKVPSYLQVPDPPKVNRNELLWNHPRHDCECLLMDATQVSKVKTAMAGFQLPAANIPDWAQNLPEDQWKQLLVARLAHPPGSKEPMASASQANDKVCQNVDLKFCHSKDGHPNSNTDNRQK